MTEHVDSPAKQRFFHLACHSRNAAHVLQRPRDYRGFLCAFERACAGHSIRIVSYCVLSNEWHVLLGPGDPSEAMWLFARVVTTHDARWRMTSARSGEVRSRVAAVRPVEVIDIARHVERRAVRAGLVKRAQDWPWTSLADRLQPSTRLPLATSVFLSSGSWIAYVNDNFLGGDDLAEHPRPFSRVLELSQ